MYDSEKSVGCFSGLLCRKTRPQRHSSGRVAEDSTTKRSKLSKEVDAVPEKVSCFNPCCDFAYSSADTWWVYDNEHLPMYTPDPAKPRMDDVATTVDTALDGLSPLLRDLSLKIHSHPELQFNERYAHDLLTNFMSQQGFKVTRHYLGLDTAWRAEYTKGKGGRVVGINSEMDALKGIGHACGHNLIAISGVGVAIALKAALDAQTHASGKIILLGTPAEEGGGGKIIMLDKGGYSEMDICLMCHPGPGPPHSTSVGPTIAMQSIEVEYFGHSAHAGAAPWEGTNALDAAFLAYSSISMLRQQIKPDHRIHGIVEGKNWQANVIPDYAKMRWISRAPTSKELLALVERVQNCIRAGAVATGCTIEMRLETPYFDLHQNPTLGQCFADIVGSRYGVATTTTGTTASTDFGNVSYALPALHPAFAIPTEPNGGNHTAAFAKAARTEAAHEATMVVMKGLALTGYRIFTDSDFFHKVRTSFEANAKQPRFDEQNVAG